MMLVEHSRFVSIDNCVTLTFCTWAYGYGLCVCCDSYLFGVVCGTGGVGE